MVETVEEANTAMKVRGKALIPMPKFVKKKFGKEGLKRWLDAISVEAHQAFVFTIKSSEWYPLTETFTKPTANIAQLFYDWNLKKAAWELGRFSADFGLKYLKLIVKIGSPNFLLNKAGEIMSSYYNPSKIEIVNAVGSNVKFRISNFPEMNKAVEYRIAGWIERALEINGCKNVNIKIPKSITNFNAYSEFHVSWE
ncbi:MAG: hypothetical protein PVH61_04400 [Candidatus Aminicenantes bacterium]